MRAVLAMLAPERALRVVPGGCAPLFPCVARHGWCIVRPGRESRHFDRTGKPVSGSRRLDHRVPLRIERDRRDRRPVAGCPAPALWVGPAGTLVEFVLGREHVTVVTGVSLRGRYVANAAVPVDVVIPIDKASRPFSRRIESGEAFDRELRPVFRGAEQSLGIGIVVADARARVRRFDAEPMQHGQDRGAFRVAPLSLRKMGTPAWHGRPRRGPTSSQMRGVVGAVGVVHLETDDLAAVEVEGISIEIEPSSLHGRGQERSRVPAPGHVQVRWRCAWSVGETGAVAGRVPGGSSGCARAAPDGSLIRWRYRRLRRPAPERSGRAASRRSGVRSRPPRYASALLPSGHATARTGSRPAAGRRVSDHRSSASVGWCAGRHPPATGGRLSGTAGAGLRRFGQIRVWRSSRRVMRPRLRGRSPGVFLIARARRPFRPAPCPCDAVPAQAL